jgi:hypothetical protein
MNTATAIIVGFALGVATVGVTTVASVVAWRVLDWRRAKREDVLRRAMVTHSVLEGVGP